MLKLAQLAFEFLKLENITKDNAKFRLSLFVLAVFISLLFFLAKESVLHFSGEFGKTAAKNEELVQRLITLKDKRIVRLSDQILKLEQKLTTLDLQNGQMQMDLLKCNYEVDDARHDIDKLEMKNESLDQRLERCRDKGNIPK